MGEVKVQSHKVDLAYLHLQSILFHVKQPSYSCDKVFKI